MNEKSRFSGRHHVLRSVLREAPAPGFRVLRVGDSNGRIFDAASLKRSSSRYGMAACGAAAHVWVDGFRHYP